MHVALLRRARKSSDIKNLPSICSKSLQIRSQSHLSRRPYSFQTFLTDVLGKFYAHLQ